MPEAGLFSGRQMLEIAIRMEQDGRAFYTAAADSAGVPEVADLLRLLADEEVRHERTFRQMLDETQDSDKWRESYEGERIGYIEALLQSRVLPTAEQGERLAAQSADARYALDFALGFEKDTVLFYGALQEFAQPPFTDTVAQIIAEEQSHVARLVGLIRQLR